MNALEHAMRQAGVLLPQPSEHGEGTEPVSQHAEWTVLIGSRSHTTSSVHYGTHAEITRVMANARALGLTIIEGPRPSHRRHQ